ncbi:MAG: ribulose-phosphate 3-epimerase [Clostridia bacterium]|nr:ribulose-phosphate 3-epimerase [Clostridia bacterium]MBQ8751844.1 ribulose-phosphate 3-epimerase [Clostridia bacterium]
MKLSPSILTCDFAHLEQELRFVEESGADMVHLDVMDGVFVPNLTFGPPVIARMRPLTDLPFDVHLMMEYPHRLIDAFAKAGADLINIHLECASPIDETLAHIRSLGKKCALTLKPGTPAEAAFPYLDRLDMVLVMTVEPGFGGQSFMADMLPKIAALRREAERIGHPLDIEVDGGIAEKTAPLVAEAGANVAVVGSALFNATDPKALAALVHACE